MKLTKSPTCFHKWIDLARISKQSSLQTGGKHSAVVEQSPISSMRLGIDAYRKAQGSKQAAIALPKAAQATAKPNQATKANLQPGTSVRELKSQVLKSLHTQSNSGMVSMRDVAVALDRILKRQRS